MPKPPPDHATLTHRSQVAPGVYLVATVTADLLDGEVQRTHTHYVRLEDSGGVEVLPEEWPALMPYWGQLKFEGRGEPVDLRDAAELFLARLELEHARGTEGSPTNHDRNIRPEAELHE